MTRHGERTELCGAWMRYARTRCARAVGHAYEHRSAYAMDNAYRANTGREIDPIVYRRGAWRHRRTDVPA